MDKITIDTLAEHVGVPKPTLATWVQRGLVQAERHTTPRGHVTYTWSEQSVRDAETVATLRRFGFELPSVAEYMAHLRGKQARSDEADAYLAVIGFGDARRHRIVNHDEARELLTGGERFVLVPLGKGANNVSQASA